MRTFSKLLVVGGVAAALAGGAVAAERHAHVLNVVLPDGSVERIHYVGNVAPRITLAPVAAVMPLEGVAPAGVAAVDDPFGAVRRIAALMDAGDAALLSPVAMLPGALPLPVLVGLDPAALAQTPGRMVSYSVTSVRSGDKTCQQSVQVTSFAANQAPKVVRTSAGDCTALHNTGLVPAVQAAPAPSTRPAITRAGYDAPATPAKPRQTI